MSIGETLATERRRAGLTITQVSLQTRIRETVVRAIERDDFSSCGGNFYARGHIRNVARVIGIDPEPLVREYDSTHGGAPAPLSAVAAFEPEQAVPFRERRSPNWTAAMAIVLVLVVIYGIVQVVGESGQEQRTARQMAGTPETTAPSSTASPKATSSKDAKRGAGQGGAVAAAPREDVEVRMDVRKATWVSVRGDKGEKLFSGTLAKDASKRWTAKKKISVLIGNGGGVRLTVNGQDLGTPGQPGSVVRLSFTPDDPEAA